MPDNAELEPVTKAEPVALLDIAKYIVAIAAAFGLDYAEDTVLQVVVGVNAAVLLVGATIATRRRVTPVARVEDAVTDAYRQGYNTGEAVAKADEPAPPHATVVKVAGNFEKAEALEALRRELGIDITDQDIHPVANPAPPAPTTPARPCPMCDEPVVFTAIHNQRNGRWTVLPLEWAGEPDVTADFELTGDTHEAVDIMGNPAGVFPVSVHVNSSTGNNWRTHPPSHFLGHGH